MDERELIDRYFAKSQPPRADVLLGIGDDGAILREEPGFDLVVATDMIVEGTHFPAGVPAAAVGHRCLAVNLSDLAAMGAEPRWYSLALSMPRAEPDFLQQFARGLFALAERFAIALAGGDTVRGPLCAAVTAQGRIRPGTGVRRSGARPGDGIWVTGTPGDAVAGRHRLAGDGTSADDGSLIHRFLYPEPRVREGMALAGVATAMIDVSDGLHDDLARLALASGVGIELDVGALPLSAALQAVAGDEAPVQALTGGDDYELCFAVPDSAEARLRDVLAPLGTRFTRIGTATGGAGVRCQLRGRPFIVPDLAFRHF